MPSIFFIGNNGGPLEIIIDSALTPDQLASKIKLILDASGTNASAAFLANEHQVAAAQSATAVAGGSSSSSSSVPSTTATPPPIDEAAEQRKSAALQRSKEKLEIIRKEKEAEAARVILLYSFVYPFIFIKIFIVGKGT